MGIKSTKYITRELAVGVLITDIPKLDDNTLEHIMDIVADTEKGMYSRFDNFLITKNGKDPNEEEHE
jgi:hypothetical protein